MHLNQTVKTSLKNEEKTKNIKQSQDESDSSEDEFEEIETDNNTDKALDFQWNILSSPAKKSDVTQQVSDDDEDSEEDDEKKNKKNAKKKANKLTEENIAKREKELSSATVLPQTYQDYERLLAASPNSSFLWIQYMAHKLMLTEIDGAREVAERALKKIHYKEEQEKFNVFAALMNLESKFGTPETQDKVFKRALQYCEPKQVYIQQGKIYEQYGEEDKADAVYNKMCKKFHKSSKVYEVYQRLHISNGNYKKANQLLERALRNVDKKKHIKIIVRFALLNYRHGSVVDGHKVFEEVLANNPKRTDIWGTYLDAEISAERYDQVRQLFERIVNLNLSTKKMKGFLQRYLKFEREHGTPEGIERVKQTARDYISLKTST